MAIYCPECEHACDDGTEMCPKCFHALSRRVKLARETVNSHFAWWLPVFAIIAIVFVVLFGLDSHDEWPNGGLIFAVYFGASGVCFTLVSLGRVITREIRDRSPK